MPHDPLDDLRALVPPVAATVDVIGAESMACKAFSVSDLFSGGVGISDGFHVLWRGERVLPHNLPLMLVCKKDSWTVDLKLKPASSSSPLVYRVGRWGCLRLDAHGDGDGFLDKRGEWVYIGQLSDSKPCGTGVLSRGGQVFFGAWCNGVPHGLMRVMTRHGFTLGNWRNGVPDGAHLISTDIGSTHVRQYVMGTPGKIVHWDGEGEGVASNERFFSDPCHVARLCSDVPTFLDIPQDFGFVSSFLRTCLTAEIEDDLFADEPQEEVPQHPTEDSDAPFERTHTNEDMGGETLCGVFLKSLAGCRLADATFVACQFDNTDLMGTDLSDAVFENCSFKQVDFSGIATAAGTTFDDCDFVDCQLTPPISDTATGYHCHHCLLTSCTLRTPVASLAGCTLKACDLSDLDLTATDLTRTSVVSSSFSAATALPYSMLSHMRVAHCSLAGMDCSGRLFLDVLFQHCNLSDSNVSNSNWSGASLAHVNFSNACVDGAKFARSKSLTDVTFSGASAVESAALSPRMSRANFSGVIFALTDLSAVDVSYCDFSHADLSSAILPSEFISVSLRKSKLCGRDIEGVIFRDCDLTGSDLSGSRVKNCNFSTSNLTAIKLEDTLFEGCVFFVEDISKPLGSGAQAAELVPGMYLAGPDNALWAVVAQGVDSNQVQLEQVTPTDNVAPLTAPEEFSGFALLA